MSLNVFGLSSLSILISCLTMSVLVFWKAHGKKENILWAFFCLVASFWGLGGFFCSIAKTPESADFWWRVAYISPIFAPVIYSHFVFTYVKIEKKLFVFLLYLIAIYFLLIDFSSGENFFGELVYSFDEFYFPDWRIRKKIIYLVYVGSLYLFLLPYSFLYLLREFRVSIGQRKNQIIYFILGMGLGWIGAQGMIAIKLFWRVYPYINFLIASYPLVVGYAMIKHNLMDINIVFKKGLVYSVLVTFSILGYLIFVVSLGNLFQGIMGYESFWINIVAMLIIAILFNPLRNWIQGVLDKRFFNGTLESLDQERQKLQQELFQTEKLAYVGQLASSVVHEIRNPLTAIKTYVDYLPKKIKDQEFVNKFQYLMPKEIKRIENVVNHLLDLAKPRNLVFYDVSISKVIEETLTLLEESLNLKKIQVEKHFEVKDDIVSGDFDQLKQVFLNLFLNAIQAMEEDGTLRIVVSAQCSGGREKLIADDRPQVTIKISDTGYGIPKEQLEKLFTPFATTKEDGIGLGLVITKEIIEAHKGNIQAKSKEGEGTTFFVELPLAS